MEAEEKKSVTIDRSKWTRGDINIMPLTKLYRDDGCRCCIGFVAIEAGLPIEILNENKIEFLEDVYIEQFEKMFPTLTEDRLEEYYEMNDLGDDEKERERQLRRMFSEDNIEVKFIN